MGDSPSTGRRRRVVPSDDAGRVRMMPEQIPWDVEFVATDVPAFGWRRYRLGEGEPAPDGTDESRRMELEGIAVEVADDGTLTVSTAGATYPGLFGGGGHR